MNYTIKLLLLLSSAAVNGFQNVPSFFSTKVASTLLNLSVSSSSSVSSIPTDDNVTTEEADSSSKDVHKSKPTLLVGCSGAGKELDRLSTHLVLSNQSISRAQLYNDYLTEQENDMTSGRSLEGGEIELYGEDARGVWGIDAEQILRKIQEGSIGDLEVMVIDFADPIIVNHPKLKESMMNVVESLHKANAAYTVFVNIDAEKSMMSPDGTSAKDELYFHLLKYTDYELVIRDEGLDPSTVLVRDSLSKSPSGDPGSNSQFSSFEALTEALVKAQEADDNDEASSDLIKKIDEHYARWEDIEWNLVRLIAQARLKPDVVKKTDSKVSPVNTQVNNYNNLAKLMGLDTFFLCLSFDDMNLCRPYMDKLVNACDALEYRVDLLRDDLRNREDVIYQLQLLRSMARCTKRSPGIPCKNSVLDDVLPIVFTVRTKSQAGTFPDDAESISEMFSLLKLGLRGACEVVDVESAHDADKTTDILNLAQDRYTSNILGSHHVVGVESSMEEAISLFEQCVLDNRVQATKVVLSTTEESRNSKYAEEARTTFLNRLGEKYGFHVPSIGLVLGEVGEDSRVLNRNFTPVTHEDLPFKAAPGQLTSTEIMERRIDKSIIKPKKYCILGHNIAYSVSPQMHNAAYEATKLPHTYFRADVENVEDFVEAEDFKSSDFGGCSVTIPHKQSIIPYLEKISDSATKIGAVNTVIVEHDEEGNRVLVGDNTDWIGIVNPLKRKLGSSSPPVGGAMLILGGGGTARAAAYAAQQLGLAIIYFNRTPNKAVELAESFGGTVVTELTAEELGPLLNKYTLKVVMSTLPAGADFTLPGWLLEKCSSTGDSSPVVFDVNYKPYYTALLTQVEAAGLTTIRGSEMLWEQGIAQFEIWMDRTAPYQVMKNAVLENCLPNDQAAD